MKKIFIIIVILLCLAVFGFMAYLGIKGNNANTSETNGSKITFKEFLPFGPKKEDPLPNINTNTPINQNTDNQNIPSTPISIPKIRKIYSEPTAGIVAIEKARPKLENLEIVEFANAVRVVSRLTGNVIDIFPDTKEKVLVSSRVIPKIHEALFGQNGNSLILKYLSDDLETTETFSAIFVPGADTENSLKGSFLPQNIISIANDRQNGKIFYLQNFDNSSSGTVADPDTNNKKTIFSHPFYEWNTAFINPQKILFTTKPSGLTFGYSYILNIQNNVFEKLIGRIKGLTLTTSQSGEKVLIGEGSKDTIKMFWSKISPFSLQPINMSTLPEKCVWSISEESIYCAVPENIPNAIYPDSWYQGQISFRDTIEKYDISLQTNTILGIPNEQIDAINLTLSKNEKNLFFINKVDGSVWVVDL